MKDAKSIWDDLAKQQAKQHKIASSACNNSRQFKHLPKRQLVEIFIAICRTDEKYDKKLRYRRRIISLLPDFLLVELMKLRMPPQLALLIERRLSPDIDKQDKKHNKWS